MLSPHCIFCEANQGIATPARFVAAQSEDQGETVRWVLICTDHADGWNDGGDWTAPMYEIGSPDRKTAPAAVIDQDSASQPGETFTVVFRGTLATCEAWVAAREQIEPENVHRGRYGIDADFGES